MYSDISHIKATFAKHGFFPTCLINKIRCFKTLIFFLIDGPDEFSAAILFKITIGTTWLARGSRFQGGVGGRNRTVV
ncbi:hypothetical protein HanRHA438_Chr15g0712521 [Helianthus annuus]|nr:hypothetical protein HanIR_Chr15g0761591 [Helianthus annuus]KAJ0845340.1 hypothetical protein HanRHA438_Chr15g0712521 [Helianthus annuus]